MEQKTEASQAVDERQTMMETLYMCIKALAHDAEPLAREKASLTAWHVVSGAALKAQPAPAIAAKPAKYEQRFFSPQGMAAVWHDAQAETFHRHRNNGDLGDGWKHEVRALYAGPPAPTDPYQLDDDDDARFPNDTNVVILHIDRYWTLRGCEDICAALDAKPAPTEAAQGEIQRLLAENAALVRVIDGFAKQPIIRAAQGEDSARLNWLIENVSSGSIGFINGDFIGSQDFDELKVYIDRARASAETGGVKP